MVRSEDISLCSALPDGPAPGCMLSEGPERQSLDSGVYFNTILQSHLLRGFICHLRNEPFAAALQFDPQPDAYIERIDNLCGENITRADHFRMALEKDHVTRGSSKSVAGDAPLSAMNNFRSPQW